jgi:hypothetical protein
MMLHRSALSLLAQWLWEKLRKTGQSRITLYQSVRLETISRNDTDDPVLQRFTRCLTGNAYNCLPRETKRFDTKVIVPALYILGCMLVSRLYRRSKTTLSPPYLCVSFSHISLPRASTPQVAKLMRQPMSSGEIPLQCNKTSTLRVTGEVDNKMSETER